MDRNIRLRGGFVLFALVFVLSACGASSSPGASTVTNAASATTTLTTPASPPPATTATASASAAAYDTSIGSGVDANGYANLPLRSGARRYFVNSTSGSDSNGCSSAQQPGTPLKTIAAGVACVQGGSGDQVLVAEGTSYSEGLPNLDHAGGYSPTYPTVIESYDPSDPTNESKLGRAANGHRPVVNTGSHSSQNITCCMNTPASYLAIRGFDISPGNLVDMVLSIVGSNNLPNNYVLIENNIFRYTELVLDGPAAAHAVHMVVRKNSFYGEWSAVNHAQGIYNQNTDSLTVEDNVFWHVGWKVGASRDDTTANGGTTVFRHSVYEMDNSSAIIRRNFFMDPSATGCSCRGDTTILENVFIENPIAIIAGKGDNYNILEPNGVAIDVERNAILGDADINTANPRGNAIVTGNGKPGSIASNNLILRSRNMTGTNVIAFSTEAEFSQPSYITYDSNLIYRWSSPLTYQLAGSVPSEDFPTYTNNRWDAAASGTNTNSASLTFPNPYTEDQLWVALGCTDKTTCEKQMIETPETNWAVRARALLWQGYGMP